MTGAAACLVPDSQTRARRSIGRHRPSEAPALSSRPKRLSANLRVQKKARHHQRNGGVRVPQQLGSPCWGTRYLALAHLREFRGACAARRLPKRSAEVRYFGTQRVRIRDSSADPNLELRPSTLAAQKVPRVSTGVRGIRLPEPVSDRIPVHNPSLR